MTETSALDIEETSAYMPIAEMEWKLPFHRAHPTIARAIALTIIFMIGSVSGWFYETIFDLIQGHGLVIREQFLLPWCPIYGIGCALIEAMIGDGFDNDETNILTIMAYFAISAIVIAACELMASYILEAQTGQFPWDYSAYPMNLEGRIALPFTAFFAAGATFMLAVVNPKVHEQIKKRPIASAIVCIAVVLLMAAELIAQHLGADAPVRQSIVDKLQELTKILGIKLKVSVQSPTG